MENKTHGKKQNILPLIAAVLSLPMIPAYFGVLDWELPGFILIYMIVSPIAGFITGIISLCGGKKQLSRVGLVLTIIAIGLPASIFIYIFAVLTGVATGAVSSM